MRTILTGQRLWFGCVALLMLFQNALVAQDAAIDDKTLETFREGQELIQSGEFAEASKKFKQVVKEYEDFGEGWFFLAYSTHMDGKIPEALKLHRKAATFEGQFQPIAVYNIACAHSLLGQAPEALENLTKATEMGFSDANRIHEDSDLYLLHTSTDFAKLVASLNEQEDLVEQLDKGQDLINEQDFAGAAEVYAAILKENPDNDFACYRLGYSLHGAGKLDEALEYHKKATKYPGTEGIALYNWACVLSLKNDKEAAIEKLKESVESGFVRPDAFHSDPDLDNLREEESFNELVAAVEKKAEERAQMSAQADLGDDDSDDSEGEESEETESEESDAEEAEEAEDEESEAEESDENESEAEEPMRELPPYALGIAMRLEDDGVFVDQFQEGSAAEKAGMKVGDRLVKANGDELGSEPLDVLYPLLSSDDKITFEIERDGETKTIEVKPTKR